MTGREQRRAKLHGGGSGGSLRDVIGTVADGGKLTTRQTAAGDWLTGLVETGCGSSRGLVASYAARSSVGPGGGYAHRSTGSDQLQAVLGTLRPHERDYLSWLMTYAERPTGRRALHYYLTEKLGLAISRQDATPMAIGKLTALLDTVAEVQERLRVPPPVFSAVRRAAVPA